MPTTSKTLVRALLDHPGPTVTALQRRTMAALLVLTFALIAAGRALSR